MPGPSSTSLDLAEREIRQLKDTISAMRQEMETMGADGHFPADDGVGRYNS